MNNSPTSKGEHAVLKIDTKYEHFKHKIHVSKHFLPCVPRETYNRVHNVR